VDPRINVVLFGAGGAEFNEKSSDPIWASLVSINTVNYIGVSPIQKANGGGRPDIVLNVDLSQIAERVVQALRPRTEIESTNCASAFGDR
jgi:hypothetical protein